MTKIKESLPFWKKKTLEEMNQEEWESLCDGCARCCQLKVEDEDTQEVFYTHVVCQYLDLDQCNCNCYQERSKLVPNCVQLTPARTNEFHWLPKSCAYRVISEGRDLEPWHPLLSGTSESVHEAGISVRNKVIPEQNVHPNDFEDFIIHEKEESY